jgi:hypothetical protein
VLLAAYGCTTLIGAKLADATNIAELSGLESFAQHAATMKPAKIEVAL